MAERTKATVLNTVSDLLGCPHA